MKRIKPFITANARRLRKDQTIVEQLLWHHLRGRNIAGLKFRRQYAVGTYIVDFICVEKKLIIELDGGQHNKDSIILYDESREEYLRNKGYQILRFWNNDVLQNSKTVLEIINQVALDPHPDPLPVRERERLEKIHE